MIDSTTFEPLNDREREWLNQQLINLAAYGEALLDKDFSSSAVDADSLDGIWDAWFRAAVTDDEAANSFVLAYSVAFGALLVKELGFEWTIATDEHGTELAVRRFPGTADLRVFPGDFVAKRYEKREDAFVRFSLQEIGKSVAKSARQWGHDEEA